ncbi:MAG TPA: FtsX-like permease family protein, partial [Acidimicrobiales bacterium]
MRAVRYRMSRVLRAQWRAVVVLALIVGAVAGAVLAFAVGAERTSSAPDRYVSARGGSFDGEIEQESGRPRAPEVAALPGAASVTPITFVFGALAKADGSPAPEGIVFSGSPFAFGGRVVAGRPLDPASKGEFVASRTFADAQGVAIGDRFNLVTLTQDQADRAGFGAFEAEGPRGPSLDAVLVGIVDSPNELDDPTPVAVFPPSLLDNPELGVSATIMSVRLRPGTDLAAFRSQLDTLPQGATLSLRPAELISSEIRTAVQGQARALWLLTAVAAVAAIVVLGQLISRSVRLPVEERQRLEAIGFSRAQVLAESTGRAAVPIVAGTVIAVGVGVGLSTFFPTGFVRRIEPYPGVLVNPTVLALCATGLLAAQLLWSFAAVAMVTPTGGVERPSPLVESVAARTSSPTLSTGFRFAFTRSRRDRGSVRGVVTGMALTAGILIGAVVFGSSLDRLVTDGSRFGNNFDLTSGSGGDVVPDDLRARVETDPDVAAVVLYGVGHARVGSVTVGLAGMEPIRGEGGPTVLVGRLPAADDEIALGRLTAKAIGASVGADLTVEGEGASRRFRVTGLAVVPGVEGLEGVGQDGVVTMGGLRGLDPAAQPQTAAVTLRKGAPASTRERLGIGGGNSAPRVIVNLARIRSTPFVLAWLLGALALLTVVHVMVTSVRNRRRDVAVLRSLGANGRWITRVMHWQATTFSLAPFLVGVPI